MDTHGAGPIDTKKGTAKAAQRIVKFVFGN